MCGALSIYQDYIAAGGYAVIQPRQQLIVTGVFTIEAGAVLEIASTGKLVILP